MKRATALVLLTMLGCAGPQPRHVQNGVPAELDYMRGFVDAMLAQCTGEIRVARGSTGDEMIATNPPIREVPWQLVACGHRLSFTLDCSWLEARKTARCWPHEWPDIVRPNRAWIFDEKVLATFLAANAIRCRERCGLGCSDPGTVVRIHPEPTRGLTVERCGRTFDAHVTCTGDPFNAKCAATLVEVPPEPPPAPQRASSEEEHRAVPASGASE